MKNREKKTIYSYIHFIFFLILILSFRIDLDHDYVHAFYFSHDHKFSCEYPFAKISFINKYDIIIFCDYQILL